MPSEFATRTIQDVVVSTVVRRYVLSTAYCAACAVIVDIGFQPFWECVVLPRYTVLATLTQGLPSAFASGKFATTNADLMGATALFLAMAEEMKPDADPNVAGAAIRQKLRAFLWGAIPSIFWNQTTKVILLSLAMCGVLHATQGALPTTAMSPFHLWAFHQSCHLHWFECCMPFIPRRVLAAAVVPYLPRSRCIAIQGSLSLQDAFTMYAIVIVSGELLSPKREITRMLMKLLLMLVSARYLRMPLWLFNPARGNAYVGAMIGAAIKII